jgi:excisionase family DNA binding protein
MGMKTPCNVYRAAQILGKTPDAVYMQARKGKIPHRKIGGRVVFYREELEEYLEKLEVRNGTSSDRGKTGGT